MTLQTMISKHAVVESAEIGRGTSIAEFAVIRDGAQIGANCIIHPNVVVESGAIIGDGVEIFPGAYVGKAPKAIGAISRAPDFKRFLRVGSRCSIGPSSVIYYDVEIGDSTLIGDGASIREQCRIGSNSIIGRHVTMNYDVTIGDRTKVMDHTWLCGNMTVGDDVFISGGVLTANDNSLGRSGYISHEQRGPAIEDHAMIGAGAILLPNISIGRGAIVAAGSIVTKSVPPAKTALGAPARILEHAGGKASAD